MTHSDTNSLSCLGQLKGQEILTKVWFFDFFSQSIAQKPVVYHTSTNLRGQNIFVIKLWFLFLLIDFVISRWQFFSKLEMHTKRHQNIWKFDRFCDVWYAFFSILKSIFVTFLSSVLPTQCFVFHRFKMDPKKLFFWDEGKILPSLESRQEKKSKKIRTSRKR